MHAGGLLGHVQRRPDLTIGGTAGKQREHLELARRQPERQLLRWRHGVSIAIRGCISVAVAVCRLCGEAPACDQRLDLTQQPGGTKPARYLGGAGGDAGCRLTVAGFKQSLGLPPPRGRGRIGSPKLVPGCGRR